MSRGQFFTVNKELQKLVVELLEVDSGKVLEPSMGRGDLALAVLKASPHITLTGVEIDSTLELLDELAERDVKLIYGDFFSAEDIGEDFDAVVGNPPYVSLDEVEVEVLDAISNTFHKLHKKGNLYQLFFVKCIDLLKDDGELIFIIPKDWLYLTSGKMLRKKIRESGALTHMVDLEEKVMFQGAAPNLSVVRFQKGVRESVLKFSKDLGKTWIEKQVISLDDRFLFLPKGVEAGGKKVGDFVDVKIGVTTGYDAAFRLPVNKVEKFSKLGVVKKMYSSRGVEDFLFLESSEELPSEVEDYLKPFKERLLSRSGVKEKYWYRYATVRNKEYLEGGVRPIFVGNRTRNPSPFFLPDTNGYFLGNLIGLYPKDHVTESQIQKLVQYLNSEDFKVFLKASGMMVGDRLIVNPKTLEQLPVKL